LSHARRVTRLGEFLPNGRIFAQWAIVYLGHIFKSQKYPTFLCYWFPLYRICIHFDM
jgi:hypothetical protein